MTFSSITPLITYTATAGQTDFPLPNQYYDVADARAWLVNAAGETAFTNPAGFSVIQTATEAIQPGLKTGLVRLVTPRSEGDTIIVGVWPAANQDQKYHGIPITARQRERVVDRGAMGDAMLRELVGRAYRTPLSDEMGIGAGRVIGPAVVDHVPKWDENGNLVPGPSIAEIEAASGVAAGRALIYPEAPSDPVYDAGGRRIGNIADGVADQDAATVAQLEAVIATILPLDYVTVTAIKAIADPTLLPRVGLLEAGREGEFIWKTGDYTARIAADPLNGFYIKNDNVSAATGAYVRVFSNRPRVTWWGALLTGAGNQAPAFQAALDLHGSVLIPNGIIRCTSPIQHGDNCYIQFESIGAQLLAAHSGAGIEGKSNTTQRRFFMTIESGKIYGDGGLSYGVDMLSTTYGLIKGTWLNTVATAWRNGGTSSQGSFYNEAEGATITTVTTGVINGTLGNEIKMRGGSIKDCVVGTNDDDNSGVVYEGVAIETFTGYGCRVSNSGDVSYKIRHRDCRFENPSTTGAYASAVAIRWNAAAQNCRARDNQITTVASGIVDSGTTNQESGN